MLTRKQFELLRFIHERLKEAGVPPSFDEMKDALDLRSKSGIHRLITALEERGFIRRLPNRARAIEVIKLPESVAHGLAGSRTRGFTPSVIEGNLGRVRTASEDDGVRPVAVPVMGRIAAGTHPVRDRVGQLDHLNGPRPIRQPSNEAALLQRRDQPMDAGFRTQVERVLHLVEGGRHAILLQALMNEAQQFELFAGEHLAFPPLRRSQETRRNKS